MFNFGFLFIKCPYKAATGSPCIFCGTIRSFLLAIRGHIREACSVNPIGVFLFLSMIVAFVTIGIRLLLKCLKGGGYGS